MAPRRKKDPAKLALQNSIAGRTQFLSRLASQAGIQYSGKRDIYSTAGYLKPGSEKFEDYWGLYERGEVAGRIVDMPAKTTWRTPPEVVEEGKEDSKFAKEFATMAKRLKLWRYFNRVDRLAGVGRYAVIFIGVKGVNDQQLKQPLSKVSSPDDIVYLSVYHEKNAEITEYENDAGNPRFGLPKTYKLRVGTDSKFKGGTELLVDASRVIHVAEDVLDNDIYGKPRLRRALNRLFDLDKVAASTGEAYWQAAVRILQAKVDPQAEISGPDLEKLDEKLGEMVHDLKRHFYGQGVELSWLPEQTPNVSQVAEFFFSLISAAAEIPKRILFGSEIGELASTTDQATYFGRINERQEQFAEPDILRAFVDKMIGITALTKPADGDYQVNWPPLFEETADAKAGTSLKVAQTAQALTPVGANPLELVTIDSEGVVQLIEREEGDALPESHDLPADQVDVSGDGGDGGDTPAAGEGATPPGSEPSGGGSNA
jgi:phage-related protein (TIGR01555 family)